MSARTLHSLTRYVTLAPLAVLCTAQALLLSWLTISGRLATTRVSVAVALLVLATGLLPALIRPGPLTGLASCITTLLASIVIAPLDTLSLPDSRSLPALLILPGGTITRLVALALLGPLFAQCSASLLGQQQLSRNQMGLSIMVGVLLAGATLGLTRPLALIASTLLIIWFALFSGLTILRVVRARTHQARLLLTTILVAELPLLVRPILAAAGLVIPYDLVLITQLFLPIGIGYTILRHDLFGIDALVRRALAYTLLSAAMLALYFGVTAALTTLLARILPQARGAAVLVGLFAAAAAFAPLRGRAQHLIDQALYPERLAFHAALKQAHIQLAQVIDREAVRALLQETLPSNLGATWAELTESSSQRGNHQHPEAWSVQLQTGTTVIGHYWLGPRHSGLPFDPDEQVQLADLTQRAALALAYSAALEQLQSLNDGLEARVATQVTQMLAQQRALVLADERRRLARDLHDSVTQTLFSMNLGARAIRGLLLRDSDAAQHALVEQEAAAQQALAEMRELLAQLRSPIGELADQTGHIDLSAQLHAQCAELQQRGDLAITLQAPPHVFLPTTLALGLAHISREALYNTLKHSGTRTAQVTLTQTPTTIILSITDQGYGFEIASVEGTHYGLRGMDERAEACGGILEVVSSPGLGTTVRATVQYAL